MNADIKSRAVELLQQLPGKVCALHTFPEGGYLNALKVAIKALEDNERLEAERDSYKRALEGAAELQSYMPDGSTIYVTSESIVDKEIALRMDAECERDYWKARAKEEK